MEADPIAPTPALAHEDSAANNAATWAASAQSQLTSLGSDNVLYRSEKPRIKQMYDDIVAEIPALVKRAQDRDVDPSIVQGKQYDLGQYLGGLTPSWFDFNHDTSLPPPGGSETLRAYFCDYYVARVNLESAIDGKARSREYPIDLTPALVEVLGQPNFQLHPIWMALREVGFEIKPRYENEAAAALHFLIPFALDYGLDWRSHAAVKLRELKSAHDASQAQTS